MTFQRDELATDYVDDAGVFIDSCLNYSPTIYGNKTHFRYIEGLGIVHYGVNGNHYSESNILTGCLISGVTIGDPQWVPESDFPDSILINGTADLSLSLLSNITSGSLMLNPSMPSGSLFSIFDASGKLLNQGTASSQEINVAELATGFYLIKIEWNGAYKVSRFFVY